MAGVDEGGMDGAVLRLKLAAHSLTKRLDHLQIVEGALVWLEDNTEGGCIDTPGGQ